MSYTSLSILESPDTLKDVSELFKKKALWKIITSKLSWIIKIMTMSTENEVRDLKYINLNLEIHKNLKLTNLKLKKAINLKIIS